MQFDDRLATVLRTRAASDAAVRTQLRQLLDLLGTASDDPAGDIDAAYARLDDLLGMSAPEDQSAILRGPGLRLRNPRLVRHLAGGEARAAAAAMATAQLTEDDWLALVPALPVTARGFLRHRRDLPDRVRRLLAELGVGDLVLPGPDQALNIVDDRATTNAEPAKITTNGIGELRRRIEAFREQRRNGAPASAPAPASVPAMQATADVSAPRQATCIEFLTGPGGEIVEASTGFAPQLVGLAIAGRAPSPGVQLAPRIKALLAARQPVREASITIAAGPAVSGAWTLDAVPLFDAEIGGFTGYRGCLRTPAEDADLSAEDGAADQMRQVLHELRTPVNAIQGFAEIIQQQLFGAVPHEYRAHAAAIAVDAAKLLAGFDEVDRLVKLEGGAMALDPGITDFRAALEDTVIRLDGVLRPRGAGFRLAIAGDRPFNVAMDRSDALALCWRILATAAGSLAPGETLALQLSHRDNGALVRLRMALPTSLLQPPAPSAVEPQRRGAVSAGMFGPAFTFRLAAAEVRAVGGQLKCKNNRLSLSLPSLTGTGASHSEGLGQANG